MGACLGSCTLVAIDRRGDMQVRVAAGVQEGR